MTVRIDFGSGYLDVSDLVKYDTFTLTKNAFNNNYKASQSVCNFSMIFDPSIYSIWLSTTDIKVEIVEDSTVTFRGLVDKTRSKEYNGKLDNIIIDIEANDYLTLLDAKVGDILYSDCKVLDSADPTNSIVHKLVAIATTDVPISSDITISTVIARFSPGDEKQTVKNILDTLLYEYGYSLHLENGYELLPIKWSVESPTVAYTFNDTNCIGSISTKDTLDKYDATTVIYNILASANNVRLYTDNNCGYDSNGEFAGFTIPNTFYYPPEANVIDDTTGTNQLVYQDYTDEGITYRTNKAIVQNLDYNYKNFDSDFKAIVTTENHFVDRSMDAGITVTAAEFFAKKCRLLYRNNTGSAKQIYYNNVYGTVWYRSADCSSTVGDKDSDKLYTYTSQYIFDKTTADTFVKALHAQHTAGNTIYRITSDDLLPEGALVLVDTNDGTNRTCQISSVTYNEKTNLYTYNCVSCKSTRLGLTSQTYNFRGTATLVKPFSISPSTKTINVPYVDGAPVYTNAYVSLAVMQEGINVTSGWTLTATPTGVTGHFEGSSYFIDTAPATGGSVVITASKTGFDAIATIVQVEGTDGGSTWQPLAPLVDVVAIKDGLEVTLTDKYLSGIQGINSYTATWYYNDVEQATMAFGDLDTVLLPFASNAFYEVDDIDTMSVKVRVVNTSGLEAITWVLEGAIDTDNYGTWLTTAPVLSPYASKRDFTVSITQGYSARQIYGDIVYRAEIKRYDDVDYYKPNLTADPYESEDNYKDGAGYVTVTSYIQQRVPLENQATAPQSTSYTYRFTTVNATTGIVGASATVTLIASASTAQDIVNKSMDAEKLNVQDLAAVSTVFGSIRSDGIAKDSTNFWNLSDPSSALGYGQEGEMCVGTSASVEVFDPVTNQSGYKDTDSFFHFIPSNTGTVLKGLYLKLANFIITAVKSVVTGMFEVVQRQTAKTIFKVDDESEYTSGIQTETSITLVDDDAPLTNTIIDKLTRKSVVINSTAYHLVPDEPILLIQNLSTGIETQVATPLLFKGIHNIGGVLHAIGAGDAYSYVSDTWTQIPIDWIKSLFVQEKTFFANGRNRSCCIVKDNFLYIPISNGTVLEVVDLTTFTVQDKTLSAGNRNRFCCAIKDNFLYIPVDGGTVLEVVDLTTFTVQDKVLSASYRYRNCCAIKDNFLYIPIYNGTVLEVVDLTNFTVQDKTLSAGIRNRRCCAIKDNFLYIPTNGTVLEVVDLTTLTVQDKVLSASGRNRFCCAIKDNFLYIPINGGTVLEVVDLTTLTVQDKVLSASGRNRFCCEIKDNFLYIPISNGTVLEVVDLTTFTVQDKTLSASNRYRLCCAIKDNFLYIPIHNYKVLEVVAGLPYLQHKTTTNNTTHILSTSTGVIETIKASDGEYVSLPAPNITGSPLSITIGAVSFFPDFTTGKITKYNAGTITTVNTTVRANIKTLITDGTNMFISGLGNVIYKVAQDGTQTALTLSQLSNSMYHTLGIIGTKMYVIPETSSPRFAEVNLSTFALIQYALFSPSWGALRGEGVVYNSKYWLAEKNTKKQHRLAGIKEALSDIKTLKPIGSGFIDRTINVDGTTELETADGERVIFGADKNLIAPTATTATTATLANKAKDSYPIPTDAVLQYSFDEIKQLPDNPAGTTYKRDNDWTTVDGWIVSNGTASFSDGKIIFTSTTPDLYFTRNTSFSGSSFTKIVLKFYGKQSSNTGQIFYSTSSHGFSASYTKVFFIPENGGITFIDMTALSVGGSDWVSSTITAVRIDLGGGTGQVFTVESIYIGDGSYLEPVIDNSYSEAHAENHGVIPVDGVCGKAGYFNNSYMIAPRPALGDDITIYFWAKFDALATGAISQTILQSRTVHERGLNIYQALSVYRFIWRGDTYFFSGYTPPVNTWHHVCMKMNATTKVLKINGATKVTLTGIYGTTTNLASTIWSGMAGTGGTLSGNPLTGALDGLKIVPRFTTDDEDTGEYKARANLPKFYATADKWKTARNVSISDADGTNTGTAVSVDGSENETLKLPATIKANLTGNAATATKLETARKINGVDFDGTADIYDTYSTTEHRIGTWIDGKPLYRKVIDFGTLPNSTTKTVAHGVSSIDKTIRLYGIAQTATVVIPIPYATAGGADVVNLRQDPKSSITITTGVNRTTYTAIVFIEYTKTTD